MLGHCRGTRAEGVRPIACQCQGNKKFIAYRPDGSQATYTSESQASADVRRNGGYYSAVAL